LEAAFRVRIALNLNGATPEDIAINLNCGDQFKAEYKRTQPAGRGGALGDGDAQLFRYMALASRLCPTV
jgi:glutathione S-transferase